MRHWEDEDLGSFRREVRAFCAEKLPQDIRNKVELGIVLEKEDQVRWQKILHQRGWFLGHWPREQGGQGWDVRRRFAFLDEATAAGAPRLSPFGLSYVGPVLYTFGTKDQCDRYLPGIRNSDTWWCQGYSEPNAGSDLANLKTRAVRDGDSYRVTGQKIWTTTAHWADMMFCLVRTSVEERPQQGITFLLIDMKSPGVSVRPITTMDMVHETNEVFLDDVVVPVENRVGEEGKGWTYAKFLLDNERISMIYVVGRIKLMLRQLRELAGKVDEGQQPISSDPYFWRDYAALEVDAHTLEALVARQLVDAGVDDVQRTIGASILKLRCTEVMLAIAQAQVDLMARLGLPYDTSRLHGDGLSRDDALMMTGLLRGHLSGRAATIYGGTSEIQKNIVAKAIGL
ncbi:acyl-CoA dehydrogenase family protein [Mesorhizobium sp. CAU 1741]|uniref:acyl-CoA dehydrogenase family protein n=1 Tax=Mesorhizobium sp. CAU 1741 TaxID=3140366 RepID=UPI00325C338B